MYKWIAYFLVPLILFSSIRSEIFNFYRISSLLSNAIKAHEILYGFSVNVNTLHFSSLRYKLG